MASNLSLFDLAPGKVVLDRWEILRSHRQGGMAATFEASDREQDGPCELQIFPAALFESRQQAADFAVGMEAWLEIDAPAVARVRAVELLDDGTLLLATDFPPGGALRAWLKQRGPMPVDDARALGERLLGGLTAIHGAGQVHGDIKPYTIHLPADDPSAAVLIDGGITRGLWTAKHLGDKTALIGTPFYAPVEQFGGDSPDVQSDIYNVATVLYELVTGVVPWAGKSFLEVFQAKLEPSPPTMKSRAPEVDVPEAFERAVLGGIATDRRERYSTAEEFRAALAAAS